MKYLLFLRIIEIELLEWASPLQHINVELKIAIARTAYGRERAEHRQTDRAHIPNVDQFAVTETGRPIIYLGIRWINQNLARTLIWQEQPEQIVEETIDLRYFKIEAIRQITGLL